MRADGIVLRAARDEEPVGACAIDDGPVSIGSWAGATLPLDDARLPPVAVVLDPEGPGRWRLVAVAAEGCRVNGDVVRRALITSADRIGVGPYEIEFARRQPSRTGEFSGRAAASEPVSAVAAADPPVPSPTEKPLRAVLRWKGAALDTRVLAPSEVLKLGHGRRVMFELPGGDTRCWVGAAVIGGRWHVALDAPARATSADDGRPLLSTAARADGPAVPRGFVAGRLWAPIPVGTRVRLEAGALSIDLERSDTFTLERVAVPPWWTTPGGQTAIIAALVFVFLVAMLRLSQSGRSSPDSDLSQRPDLIAQFQRPPAPTPEMKEQIERWQKKIDALKAAGAEKSKGEEGEAGKPTATERNARRAGPLTDAEVVQNQSLLKMLSSGTTQELLSSGTLSAASAVGHLDSSAAGDAQGTLGLGMRGNGPGAGGLSADTVGVGPVGTKGVGLGAASAAGKVARGGQSDLGMDEPAAVQGGLDREVIRRVILSHRVQIRYCYEKQLSVTPDISGKVSVEFVIAADGSVTTARAVEQTITDPEVGRCIVSKVKTWTFPKPKGNGVVVVTYPFLFKPAGQGAR